MSNFADKLNKKTKPKSVDVNDFFNVTDPKNMNDKIVCDIPISELHAFSGHPFKVNDNDDKMLEMKESIEKQGVIYPIIVRPKEDNMGFEIIAGHRRTRACELLGIENIPALVKRLDDEESTILMVDSNIQREELLFSEKAFAYKMKLDAIKRRAGRPKDNCVQVEHNYEGKRSEQIVAEESGENRNQIRRYIRLTYLIKELLEMTDEKGLPFTTAVELSHLVESEQQLLLSRMLEIRKPSLAEAKKLKEESVATDGGLTSEFIEKLLMGEPGIPMSVKKISKSELQEITTRPLKSALKKHAVLQKYFSEDVEEEEIRNTIFKLLEDWHQSKG